MITAAKRSFAMRQGRALAVDQITEAALAYSIIDEAPMDISTSVALFGGAIASKDIMIKVLGPTADYVGGELKNLVGKCNVNLSDVFDSSLRKGAEDRSGAVDPRTAKAIIDDAAFCKDALIKDYYGGLMCAAKSDNEDDEALTYVSILKGMSRIQVKTHFLIYALLNHNIKERALSITVPEERDIIRILIPFEKFFPFLGKNAEDYHAVINHVVGGLLRSGLVGPMYCYGEVSYVNSRLPELNVKEPSLVVTPSVLGAELFLWAAGIRNPDPNVISTGESLLSKFPEELVKEFFFEK